MGAIRLATSNSTDEEYGGTFPVDASDISYDANTTVKQVIEENTVVDALSFTRGSKVSAGTSIQAKKYGKLVVASGYVEVTSAMVRDDIIASFSADEINVFLGNFFTRGLATDNTGFDINLKGSTRNIVADGPIASGKVLRFQIVGITI